MKMTLAAALIGAAVLSWTQPSYAQKSQDTVRLAIQDMFPGLDSYVYPTSEASQFHRDIYESVIAYDARNGKYVPVLAKSWVRVAPNVIEMELRDDVKFHSGNPMTADDAIYTWTFFADPATKLRSPSRYNWIDKVEKLGPYKLRIVGKQTFADDIDTVANYFNVFDSKVHKTIPDFADYGRVSASGTGPYKLISLDNRGVTLERYDGYQRPLRAASKRIIGVSIPDEQTRIAQLLTGGIDVIRNISTDNAKSLAANPNIKITNVKGGDIIYITLDAIGRSENKALTDPRVRKAFMMAIDRDTIIKQLLPGGGVVESMDAICFKWVVNCAYSSKVTGYDPAGAKKLLTEAGFPNGLDLQLSVWDPVKFIAEAVSGDLRKVGIRATVQTMPLATYVRLRGRGELTTFIGTYPIAGQPNLVNLFDLFFLADRDYYNDDLIMSSYKQAVQELDETKRKAIYEKALNRINEMNYIYPFSSLPAAFAHSKDVKIVDNYYSPYMVDVNDLVWADYNGK